MYTQCRSTTRTDVNSNFFMNNMTNSLRKFKKSYSENTEFSCWLFPYPLSVQGTTIAIRQTFLGITSISLSAVSLYCTVNTFFFEKFNRDFFLKINSSRKQTPDVALTGFLSGDCFSTGGLKFLISRKVLFSGDAKIDVYTSPYII